MKSPGRPRIVNHSLVIQEIKKNLPAKTIAQYFGISSALVYKIARENNLKTAPVPSTRKKYDYKLIVDTYFELDQNGYKTDEKLNLPYGQTSKVLKKLNIHHRIHQGRPKEHLTLEEFLGRNKRYKGVFDLHNQGKRPVEIDIALNLHRGKAAQILTKLKIPHMRKCEHLKIVDIPKEDVIQMYSAGHGTAEIGRKYQHSGKVIRRILAENGIERRIGGASGSKNSQWKGGKSKEDPMHYYRRQCYEVAAICLGKPVPRGYVIHHLDENPKNNYPDNLILFPLSSNHLRFHQLILSLRREVKKEEAILLAIKSGAVELPKPPAQFELESYKDDPDPSQMESQK